MVTGIGCDLIPAEDHDILEFHGCKCNTRRIVGLWGVWCTCPPKSPRCPDP
jgi:hypothetical protein